jgi:hypothetical protein
VLEEAKSALVGYVAREVLDLTNSVPGRLPCPESPSDAGTTNEGRAGSTCDPTFPVNKSIGRLPWRTLGVDKLVDAASEPLWYAVSPNWVPGSATPVINAGKTGQLSVDGTGGVVAILIAPGRPMSIQPNSAQSAAGCQAREQAREDRGHNPAASANPDYRDYLECQNASDPIDLVFGTSVVDNATNPVLNDQIVVVTAQDVLNAIQGPLAERMQRTVAPLLSEYSDLWPGGDFLPYAVAFATPESALALGDHCGPATTTPQETEGLLPLAPNAGTCVSSWTNFAISGSVNSLGCTTLVSTNVRCTFQYYRLTGLGQLLLGPGATATDVTVQATAPHAAASFREPLQPSDVIVPAGVSAQAATFTPQTDGDARLSLTVRISATNLCDNILLGVVCNLLSGLIVSSTTVSVEFPQLASSVSLQGTKLSTAVRAAHAAPYDLLSPTSDDPHYWFMQNEWYRYTYYAVAPIATAAASGSYITVSGFPAANGGTNDKRFTLTLMGPPVTGQVRGATATLDNYLEGENKDAGDQIFAHQVYALAGNDRLATCPFNDGALPCD